MSTPIGVDAIAAKGWPRAHQWLLLRRISQIGILALFLLGPWFGVWIVKGNLTSSLTLNMLPLTDPFVLLQTVFAGHLPRTTALTGALVVLMFYFLVGGRVYCSWVCPVNIVTDAAGRLRTRLGLKDSLHLARSLRYWLLGMSLGVAALTGTVAWELVNPVSMLHRGLLFGFGLAGVVVPAVFLFDLLVSTRGWCGHLCPVGAFYSVVGRYSPLRISATNRAGCNDCMDCFAVCPEPQVIGPALKGSVKNIGPLILSPNCTNCGRCIDVCSKNVFHWSTRYNNSFPTSIAPKTEVLS